MAALRTLYTSKGIVAEQSWSVVGLRRKFSRVQNEDFYPSTIVHVCFAVFLRCHTSLCETETRVFIYQFFCYEILRPNTEISHDG